MPILPKIAINIKFGAHKTVISRKQHHILEGQKQGILGEKYCDGNNQNPFVTTRTNLERHFVSFFMKNVNENPRNDKRHDGARGRSGFR